MTSPARQNQNQNFSLNDDERDAVDALIEYRLRLADKPFIKPLSLTPELKKMSDSVLERERNLLVTLTENIEEEAIDLLGDKEALFLALARHKEMSLLLEGGLARASNLRNQLVEMKREKDRRKAVAMNLSAAERAAQLEHQAAANLSAAMSRNNNNRSSRSGGSSSSASTYYQQQSNDPTMKNLFTPSRNFAGISPHQDTSSSPLSQNNNNNNNGMLSNEAWSTNLTTKSLEDIERQVQIESSLAQHSEKTLTVLYPTYLDFIGRIAMMRRRCDLEKDWSVSTANELEVVENKMKTLKSQDSYRKQQLAQAREKLDQVNRAMFMSRRELTVTHHRILGLEKLKNGAVIDAQTSIDLVHRIRRELQENNGESETFQRLMDTECAELCDISIAPNSYSDRNNNNNNNQSQYNATVRRQQQQLQQQYQDQSAINNSNNQGPDLNGAAPFVMNNASKIPRR
jgi:hypothetical protein